MADLWTRKVDNGQKCSARVQPPVPFGRRRHLPDTYKHRIMVSYMPKASEQHPFAAPGVNEFNPVDRAARQALFVRMSSHERAL